MKRIIVTGAGASQRCTAMIIAGVIPARYASTRLPGKPLIVISGKPLIQWVWEAAQRCKTLQRVIIATDDDRIRRIAIAFGAEVVMTPPECPSGSDRIAAALKGQAAGIIANIQGDEPLMDSATVDACVEALVRDSSADVASAMVALSDESFYYTPHVVKVVTDASGYAMYFSRAAIPDMSRLTEVEREAAPRPMKHQGLYVYRRAALEAYVTLQPSRYELVEKLEQLRFLENGYRIKMVQVTSDSLGVDTPEDVVIVERILAAR